MSTPLAAKITQYDFKINHFHVNGGTDIRKELAVGQYANTTVFFDSVSQVVSVYDYKLLGDDGLENQLGGDDEKEESSNELKMLNSRLFVRVSDHGTLGIGTDGFQTSGIDQAYQAKAASRYNQLFSQSVDIQIPLNTNIKVGDIIKGAICKGVGSFGVFFNVNNELDVLVHLQEISYSRVSHPDEIFNIGEKHDLKVISVDKDKLQVGCSVKQLSPDPFEPVSYTHLTLPTKA